MAVSLPPAHRHRVSIRQAGLVAALVSVGFGRSIPATVVFVRTRGRGWQVAATHTSAGHEPSPD